MPSKPLYLIGSGGHARVILDILAAQGLSVEAFLDDAGAGEPVMGLPVLAGTTPVSSAAVIIAIGDNHTRRRVAQRYVTFATAIHPRAVIANDVVIGEGSVIMAGAVINTGARIGRHCIVNTGCSIDHDCVIGDFTHIGPGATLGGGVSVGGGTMIGLGANVIHLRRIGSDAVVGAGATVIDDVGGNVVAVGCPARVIRSRVTGEAYL